MLKWVLSYEWSVDGMPSWITDYRDCKLVVTRLRKNYYSVFIFHPDSVCSTSVHGRDSLHRARKAAVKFANALIQSTHHESKRRAR